MVIFNDLQKLLLYQSLNLGFECDVCKRKFYNRLEHLLHVTCCKASQKPKCDKCGKTFGHQKILQLHMQFHNLSKSSEDNPDESLVEIKPTTECIDISESDEDDKISKTPESDNKNQTELTCIKTENILQDCSLTNENPVPMETNTIESESSLFNLPGLQKLPKQTSHTVRVRRKTVAKKRVGLTKVRMEDCLRCDACSCIYLDPKDYYKHMRNFHHMAVDNSPVKQYKAKKKCRSCCKQCRGVNCSGVVKRPRATQLASNLIFRLNMRDNIKDRWSRVVNQQLSLPEPETSIKPDPDAVTIKPDPDFSSVDLSHLLSQVEVKIKEEPPDFSL